MKKSKAYKIERRAQIFKALGHPTREQIMELVANQETDFQDISEIIQTYISTISKHFAILKNSRLFTSTKKGTFVYFHATLPCIAKFLHCSESMLFM